MNLFHRISTLLKADAHGVVESIEDRGLLLKQYLREARMELDRKRARLQTLQGESQSLRGTLHRLQETMESIDNDVELALKNDKEDLARFAIKKLIPLRKTKASLEARLEDAEAEAKELEEALGTQEQNLDALQARVKDYLASQAQAPSGESPSDRFGGHVADEEVELELLHRRKKGAA